MRSTIDLDEVYAADPPAYDEIHPEPPPGDWWACHYPERPFEAEHTLLAVEDCRACRIYLDALARMFPRLGMVNFDAEDLVDHPELRLNRTTMADAAKIWPIDLKDRV